MSISDVLTGLKDRVLDAATYELLKRNFDLLEDNNQILKDKADLLAEGRDKLRSENERLRKENEQLRAKMSLAQREEEFIEERGLAFLKNSDGTVKPVAYCPECKKRLTTVDHRIYICSSCKYTTKPGNSADRIAAYINEKLKAQQKNPADAE